MELGRKYHMDPRAAKRYAESPQKPEYTLSEPKLAKMDPYKQIADEWLAEAPYSALRILEKLWEMGFDGGYSIVKAYVSSRKMDLNGRRRCGLRQCLGNRDRWTGVSSRITWCMRTGSGRSCTVFS